MITCDRGGRRLAFAGYKYGTACALPAYPLLTLARPVQTSPARSHLLLVLPQRRTRSPSRACSHRQGEPRSSRSTSRDPLSVSPRRLLPPPAPSVPIARALKGSRSLSSSPLRASAVLDLLLAAPGTAPPRPRRRQQLLLLHPLADAAPCTSCSVARLPCDLGVHPRLPGLVRAP